MPWIMVSFTVTFIPYPPVPSIIGVEPAFRVILLLITMFSLYVPSWTMIISPSVEAFIAS